MKVFSAVSLGLKIMTVFALLLVLSPSNVLRSNKEGHGEDKCYIYHRHSQFRMISLSWFLTRQKMMESPSVGWALFLDLYLHRCKESVY